MLHLLERSNLTFTWPNATDTRYLDAQAFRRSGLSHGSVVFPLSFLVAFTCRTPRH
jgi:hypothetical protein